jgi:predicted hotdog family 3-hydroxylacyl-ACP dehydratase
VLIDRVRVVQLVPHSGTMCLLETATSWDDTRIRCTATSHRDLSNPLRRAWGLHAICALEYAAQAMALHGALTMQDGRRASGGMLAAARDLVLHRARLDQCSEVLTIEAARALGESSRVIYEFRVLDAAGTIAEGRAAVVLEASS